MWILWSLTLITGPGCCRFRFRNFPFISDWKYSRELYPTTFDAKVKPNFLYKQEIRYSSSDSYSLPKSQVRSWTGDFGYNECFCQQILHRCSAPRLYQRISDAKVMAFCVPAFHLFHRLCFYIFFRNWKPIRWIQRHLTPSSDIGFCSFFIYLLLKQNFQAYERNGSIAQAPQGIEPALNRFCLHFFGHPYSKSWST